MNVKIRRIDGLALAGFSNSNHWVTMDAPTDLGGFGAGPRPMELMLIAIAGCAAMDVLAILKKKRARIDRFDMEVKAEQENEHPQVFTIIDLNYTFTGDRINPVDVERAIKLTDEKYCAATAMVKGVAKINHHYRIEKPEY